MSEKRPAPLIGITCEAVSKRRDFSAYDLVCDHRYATAVKDAGGHPVLLPIAHQRAVLHRYLEGIDGLVIVGGDDVDPKLYGEPPERSTRIIFSKRTAFESWLYKAGKRRELPILGICYGMQLINALEGGTLHQHLPDKREGGQVDHHKSRKRTQHTVRLLPGTRLQQIFRVRHAVVASQHHQAVRDLASGFVPAAVADDGIIEAIEHASFPQILAVQWHPERLPQSVVTRRLFRAFVRTCARYRERREE
ncbi:MAG: gamma-glutamyl-gamma-aminobutyrate hydrolase family protein [Candidatus Binatia bacterium]